MARILICHVPKDASLARDLGAALMGRGHFVSFDGEPDAPRPERASRLRQFEAVMVLWTEASAQNAALADIARDMLPLNVLVPVRSGGLALARLPLMFRKLAMMAPGDIDGIARVVARMSTAASSLREMAERDAARRAAPPPLPSGKAPGASAAPPVSSARPRPGGPQARAAAAPAPSGPATASGQPDPVLRNGHGTRTRVRPLTDLPEVEAGPAGAARPGVNAVETPTPQARESQRRLEPARPSAQPFTADDLARAVDAGLLVHHIPAAMWLGAPATIEVALGRDILADLFPPAGLGTQGQSVETLSVSLYASAEAFEIERQSERTQFVSAKHALAARDPSTFGRWAWLVTPNAAGPQDLVVRISALLRDPRGVPTPMAIPDRRFSVEIHVPEDESLGAALAGWYRR